MTSSSADVSVEAGAINTAELRHAPLIASPTAAGRMASLRHVNVSAVNAEKKTLPQRLSSFDLFPKSRNRVFDRSAFSGAMSSFMVVVALFLCLSEIVSFVVPPCRSSLGVDLHTEEAHRSSRSGTLTDIQRVNQQQQQQQQQQDGLNVVHMQENLHERSFSVQQVQRKIRLSLDVRFPGLRCSEFGLDYTDAVGELALGVSEGLEKIPYNPLSPYNKHSKEAAADRLATGCRLVGHVDLARAKGDFHVAFGKRAEAGGGGHIHRFTPNELLTFNCSHIIDRFSFGGMLPIPASSSGSGVHGGTHALEGVQEVVTSGLGRYTYLLQIVPTTYTYASGDDKHGFQYAVTRHKLLIHVEPGKPFWQPGLFFRYDFAPYTVEYREERPPFSHLIRSLVSVVGGAWTLFGFFSISGRIIVDQVALAKKRE